MSTRSSLRALLAAALAAVALPAWAGNLVTFDTEEYAVDGSGSSVLRSVPLSGGPVATIHAATRDASGNVSGPWLGSTAAARPSPDGSQVLFRAWDEATFSDGLYVIPATGGTPVNLIAGVPVNGLLTGASWSRSGRQVTFVGEVDPGTGAAWNDEIYVVTPRTGAWRRITNDADGTSKYYPAFSPDGSQVAYVKELAQGFGLYVVPAGGGRPRLLDTGVRKRETPSWSPDGRLLAYGKFDPTGTWTDAWTVEVATGRKRNLTRGAFAGAGNPSWAGTVMFPTFSPRGDRVAFGYVNPAQLGEEPGEIWVVPARGGTARRVVTGVSVYELETGVAWSDDGASIAYGSILGPSENPNHLFVEGVSVVDVASGVSRLLAGPWTGDVHTPAAR